MEPISQGYIQIPNYGITIHQYETITEEAIILKVSDTYYKYM